MIYPGLSQYLAAAHQPAVVIVGSGPAGMTVALELGSAGIPVTMFEAGGQVQTDGSQDFYNGSTVGDPYFDLAVTRLRYLGGSSNHWAGWCRLLDAHDFEPRDDVPDTGWPIRRSDIEPFVPRVRDILGLPEFAPDRPVSDSISEIGLIKSDAVRFGQKYRRELEDSRTIATVLDTQVLQLSGDGQRIRDLQLRGADGTTASLAAPFVVVATGGLENSRLLLWSNEMSGGGAVPRPEALGRYWMEHPHYQGGDCILSSTAGFNLDEEREAFFGPSVEAMHKRQILNFGIRLVEMPYRGVKEVVASIACTVPQLTEYVAIRMGSRLRCAAQLHVAVEQAPQRQNRVALSRSARDASGVPRIELHWKKSELERRTLHEALRLFGETMVERDFGRVRVADWVGAGNYPDNHELAGHHHMGGTRMGTDPQASVVDADCRVHAMENLFVAGSSVFATSGYANPTTTIVALALRLSDHLIRIVNR